MPDERKERLGFAPVLDCLSEAVAVGGRFELL